MCRDLPVLLPPQTWQLMKYTQVTPRMRNTHLWVQMWMKQKPTELQQFQGGAEDMDNSKSSQSSLYDHNCLITGGDQMIVISDLMH